MMYYCCSVSLTRCHAGFKGTQRSAGVQGSSHEVDVQEEKQRPATVPGDQGLDDSDHGGHHQHVAATASMQRHKSFAHHIPPWVLFQRCLLLVIAKRIPSRGLVLCLHDSTF